MRPVHSSSSWENVASWYDSLVGVKGSYFHQHVIFPKLFHLLGSLPDNSTVLDLGCGQGVFSRLLAQKGFNVVGVDASRSLIEMAKLYKDMPMHDRNAHPKERRDSRAQGREDHKKIDSQAPKGQIEFIIDDARTLGKLHTRSFEAAVSILALQNIDPINTVFTRVSQLLRKNGVFLAVILHPAFRSPRITGWGEDQGRKLQYRRIDRYLSPLKVPITMNPGRRQSEVTWTYHRPLQDYSAYAAANGMVIDAIEEWVSDKQSVGKNASMENLARQEIPMFMAIRYRKL